MISYVFTWVMGVAMGQWGPLAHMLAYLARRRIERVAEREMRLEMKDLLEINAEMIRQDATIGHLSELRNQVEGLRRRAKEPRDRELDTLLRLQAVADDLMARTWELAAESSGRAALIWRIAEINAVGFRVLCEDAERYVNEVSGPEAARRYAVADKTMWSAIPYRDRVEEASAEYFHALDQISETGTPSESVKRFQLHLVRPSISSPSPDQ